MYSSYRKDTRTDNERYLEEELEREREQNRLEYEQRERERKERLREQHERWDYNERHPDTWVEAFVNQARLCWREQNNFPDGDAYFKNVAQANEKALEIWKEVAASKQEKIQELQKQIEAVQDEIRNEVADKLIAADPRREFRLTAEAIRYDALSGYCNW